MVAINDDAPPREVADQDHREELGVHVLDVYGSRIRGSETNNGRVEANPDLNFDVKLIYSIRMELSN